MPAGRPRKPAQIKKLQGTYRKDQEPLNEPEPEFETTVRKAPAYLNKWAKKYWSDNARILIDMGTLTTADWDTYESLCIAWGEFMEMYDAIHSYTDETGRRRKRTMAQYMAGQNSQTIPEYTAMNKARTEWRTIAAQFGIGASNRNKISIKEKAPDLTETEKLLRGIV